MLNTKLEAIADAIRYKRNSTNNYYLNEMPNEINNIGSGVNIQPYKVVNYSSSGTYEVLPDTGYDALNSVIVGVQAGGQDLSDSIICSPTGLIVGDKVERLTNNIICKTFAQDNMNINLSSLKSFGWFLAGCGGALTLNFYGNLREDINFTNAFRGFEYSGLAEPNLSLYGDYDLSNWFRHYNGNTAFTFYYCKAPFRLTGEIFNVDGEVENIYDFAFNTNSSIFGAVERTPRMMMDNLIVGSNNTVFKNTFGAFRLSSVSGDFRLYTSMDTPSSLGQQFINESNMLKGFTGRFYTYTNQSVTHFLKQCCNLLYANVYMKLNSVQGSQETNICEMFNWGYNILSSDIKIVREVSAANVNLFAFHNVCSNLRYAWIDLSEVNSPGRNCLVLNMFNNCQKVRSIYYDTGVMYGTQPLMSFANCFNFNNTAIRHNIIFTNLLTYNNAVYNRATSYQGGALSGTETVGQEVIGFEFYDVNGDVAYTRNVTTARCFADTTKNVYVYCTE